MGSFASLPVGKLSQGSYSYLLPLITFCCGVIKVVYCFEREKHETCYLSFLPWGWGGILVICHYYSLVLSPLTPGFLQWLSVLLCVPLPRLTEVLFCV